LWFNHKENRAKAASVLAATMQAPGEITELLNSARKGDRSALDEAFARVYRELRAIADGQLRRVGDGHTLSTTAVVHEAYIRLIQAPNLSSENRCHFFALAATVMRRVLLNHARHHTAQKRGGGRPLPLDDTDVPIETHASELVELDQALTRLEKLDERLARVVELRYFAGLSVKETAEILGVTDRTVKRDWQAARAFLYSQLRSDGSEA
jgi:RNA polymerase sigma factor (TIGR02999 family)